MTLSMRAQSALARQRDKRDADESAARHCALHHLRAGHSVASAVRLSGISRTTCDRLNQARRREDTAMLRKLLDPANSRAGRRPVLTKEEDSMIIQRVKYAASHGFAFDADTSSAQCMRSQNDGRAGFRTTNGARVTMGCAAGAPAIEI
eukprot:IDg7531t1